MDTVLLTHRSPSHENDFFPVQHGKRVGQNGGVRCRVAAFGIAYGTTNRERRGSALPVTRTQGPEQQQGEREILGDEIAGRDEKGNRIVVLIMITILAANVN